MKLKNEFTWIISINVDNINNKKLNLKMKIIKKWIKTNKWLIISSKLNVINENGRNKRTICSVRVKGKDHLPVRQKELQFRADSTTIVVHNIPASHFAALLLPTEHFISFHSIISHVHWIHSLKNHQFRVITT